MTGQTRSVYTILSDRLKVTQDIAAANVEHLRLSQISRGLMILDMKDEEDGVETDPRQDERQENDAAFDQCMSEIKKLEAELARLDRELERAANEEK